MLAPMDSSRGFGKLAALMKMPATIKIYYPRTTAGLVLIVDERRRLLGAKIVPASVTPRYRQILERWLKEGRSFETSYGWIFPPGKLPFARIVRTETIVLKTNPRQKRPPWVSL
jgi:hypothetical protein